jgi:serine/threonine-protein kinase
LGADSTFSKGDLVDRFEIRELIGQGGMGAIYRAVDTRLGRTVALKVVRADRMDSSSGDQARQRFLHEALAISKVDHRNVVRVLDFGFAGDTPYLAMEFLRGQDLGQLVKATSGLLPVAEVVDVMLGVCAAIRACHDAGIIHRDLKPSNVFLCEGDSEREVKILDFGVSKPPMASDLTREGQIVGTPQYLAPEQIDGKPTPQTDQYAIGVMLYMCLTKSLPYQNQASFLLLRAIVAGKFAPPRTLRADLPQKLEDIILRAMRTVPEGRFDSVHALGRELWEFASPEARDRWQTYYFDDRLKAPAKASTHAMPLIEAMARGMAAPGRAFAAPAAPAPAEPPRPTPVHDSVALASTATAAPAAANKPRPVAEPTPGKAPEAAPKPARTGVSRLRLASLIAGGALVLAGVGWLTSRRSGGAEPVNTVAAPAPEPAAPPPPQPPEPARIAPTPAAVPVLPQTAPLSSPPPRAEKLHRRNKHQPASEHRADGANHPADGVPIMP